MCKQGKGKINTFVICLSHYQTQTYLVQPEGVEKMQRGTVDPRSNSAAAAAELFISRRADQQTARSRTLPAQLLLNSLGNTVAFAACPPGNLNVIFRLRPGVQLIAHFFPSSCRKKKREKKNKRKKEEETSKQSVGCAQQHYPLVCMLVRGAS